MIFAAGLGTRLRPLTDHCPKALVRVAGRPMLARVIDRLTEAGFDDIIVNIHHFGEQIVDYLQQHPFPKARIRISDERNLLLDTGGGIFKARPLLDGDEPFLIHNVDIVSDVDLASFYQKHLHAHADASLLVSRRKTSRYLLFDNDLHLQGWINKATGEIKPEDMAYADNLYQELAFGGIHVFSPSLFRYMERDKWQAPFSIIPFYLSVCRQAKIQGIPFDGHYWFDVGKPDTLKQAEELLKDEASR